jgi:membrane-bound lytic murein transglycosylase D
LRENVDYDVKQQMGNNKVIKSNRMISISNKIIILLASILVFGCSLSSPQMVKNNSDQLSDVTSSVNVESVVTEKVEADVIIEGQPDVIEGQSIVTRELKESESKKVAELKAIEDKEKGQALLDSALDFIAASQEYWTEGKLEKAIATLDQAYTYVLDVHSADHPELIQQKEDLRFTISKRILEIYASRYTAINGNHNEIPLTMNKFVEKAIKRFQGPERKFFLESYKRSGKYMDRILIALKEAGLPEDLAWLPLIESGFKVRALSRARALGLWQFIPSTGYKFGLKRDTWIDERLDPEKSTTAAIAYLKELHRIFGDWTTVLAGYNCGEGRVLKKIRNQRINYLDNFWDLYTQLPRETAQYVPRFLATLHILKDPAKFGFTFEEMDAPLSYEMVEIERPVQLRAVAKALGIDFKDLSDINPELRRQVTPPSAYSLRVPLGSSFTLLTKLNEIPKWTPPENAYVYHRVKKGETLSLIALRYRTNVRKIVNANNIRRRHFIRAGQKLKIPLRGSSSSRVYVSKENLPPNGEYKVKKGDSLWLIARKFNTNTKKLQRINNMSGSRLYVGNVLKISE